MKENISSEESKEPPGYPGALQLNEQKYLSRLDDEDISEAEKTEFLQTLWSIMSALVDLGWGVDSVNSFLPALRDFYADSQGDNVETKEKECGPEFNRASAVPAAERKQGDDR